MLIAKATVTSFGLLAFWSKIHFSVKCSTVLSTEDLLGGKGHKAVFAMEERYSQLGPSHERGLRSAL